ncbi:MAG: DUF3108 domain-containing protein [Candidatus Auribacterota bacterium]|nr:DUF3108 domain-containing protein [Candidatus Auribacterota bacterium]
MRALSQLFWIVPAGFLLSGCAGGIHFTADETAPEKPFYYEDLEDDSENRGPITNLLAGEKLTYDVSWIGIDVGQLILENHGLEVINGEEAYHMTFTTIANDFLANFFKIEDTVHTWISRENGNPVRFEKVIQEGHYGKHEVIEYDQENLTATYSREDKKDREPRTMDIPPDVQDLLSIVFWLRRQPMGLGKRLKVDVNSDEKNWKVAVEIVGKGLFETKPIGNVKAYTMKPSATHEGKTLKKGELLAWVTVDRRRIPIAFEVETPIFGSATAVLSDAVLPPLPEEGEEAEEVEETPARIYQSGGWIKGLTQAVEGKR